MLLRRVITHVKAQNWTAVAIDFVIVVAGVFLGLQVQAWSERQGEREREAQIIADMLADLAIDRAQYANGLSMALRRVGAANASLEGAGLPSITFGWDMPSAPVVDYQFDFSKIPALSADEHDRLWTDVVIGYFPTPSTSTFDAIVGAGDIRVIRDRELVREMQLYRNRTDGVLQQNQKIFDIRANVLNVGVRYGLAPYMEMPAAEYYQLVARNPELAAAIRLQATFAIFHHGEIAGADTRAVQLQERLERYLAMQE